jgi:activator of HSP90 ATPase
MQGREGGGGASSSATRREWIVRAAAAAGGLAFASSGASAAATNSPLARVTADDAAANGLTHDAEAIHQEVTFKSSPKRVYDAIMEPAQFQKVSLLSGAMKESDLVAKPAEISAEPGGAFHIFGGFIYGRQIELLLAKRIVQAWRVGNWPPGVYSIAKFELTEQDGGTKLVFDHTGFPADDGASLASGWKAHYWDALTKFLA